MSEKLKKCGACGDNFCWDHDVVIVGDEHYHKDCISVFPVEYFAMLDDDPLGPIENEDGQMAIEVLGEDEYLEDDSHV